MQTPDSLVHQLKFQLQSERIQHFKEQVKLQKFKQKLEQVAKYLKVASTLQGNKHFLQQITDTTPNLLYVYDLIEQRSIYVNRAVTFVLGYSRKEIQRMGATLVKQLWHPDDIEKVHKHFQQCTALKDREVLEIEFRIKDSKGEWHWLRSCDTVFSRTPDGCPRQILGTAEDVTLRKQIEESRTGLTEAKQEEFNCIKSSIISKVARDLHTPLTTILHSADLLENTDCSSFKKQQILIQIKDAVGYMSQLLKEDVSLIDDHKSAQAKFTTTCFDALQFTKNLVRELKITKGINNPITVTSQGKIYYVQLDKKLLRQLISNLLENAIKYSSENSPIRLRFTRTQGKAIFQIQDQGMGIPSEDIPRLFDCFHRGSNVGRISGSGTGLAIVKQCVELHKGEIAVCSVVGRGTTFTVTLPQEN